MVNGNRGLPNFAVGFLSSLALLVLLVVEGAGEACLLDLWVPGPEAPPVAAPSHSSDIS